MSKMTGINFNTSPAMHGRPAVFDLFPVNDYSRFALPTSSKRGGCPSCGGAGDLLGSVKDAKNQTVFGSRNDTCGKVQKS